jgi:hypothetical protein
METLHQYSRASWMNKASSVRFACPDFIHVSGRIFENQSQSYAATNWPTAFPATSAACQDYDKILTAMMRGRETLEEV